MYSFLLCEEHLLITTAELLKLFIEMKLDINILCV